MSTFIRSRLEYAFTSKWPVNLICRLALLQEISREKDPKPEYVGIAQSILEECAKENLKFAFFRKLSPELLSPYQQYLGQRLRCFTDWIPDLEQRQHINANL